MDIKECYKEMGADYEENDGTGKDGDGHPFKSI